MFMACAKAMSVVSSENQSSCDTWYLDSICSNHMIGNIELFSSLDNSVQTKVTLGTDIQVTVLGKGNITILTKQGVPRVMNDVYYVFGLKHNLMSTGQLLQKGYRIYKKIITM